MSKGRGSMFKLLSSASGGTGSTTGSTEENSNKDSGLEPSIGSSNSRRLGRGKMFESLSASMGGLSVGSGSDTMSSTSGGIRDTADSLSSRGCGRAQVLTVMEQLSQSKLGGVIERVPASVIDSGTQLTTTTSEVSDEIKEPSFYVPDNVYGSNGSKVKMACNYIRLRIDPTKGVFLYEVKFTPPVDSIDLRIRLLNQHNKDLGVKSFDGQNLYLPTRLETGQLKLKSRDEMKNMDVEIRIQFKRQETLRQCMHLYNVLLDRIMKILEYVRFGRKQFDPTEAKMLPKAHLEIWPGYVTAVDEYDGGLMLCCDVSHRVLLRKTVLDILTEVYRNGAERFHEQAKQSLLGSMILTRYNNRTYRIDDIRFDLSPLSTFEGKNGSVTFYDYYKLSYNIEIKDRKQPLLVSIKKQKKYSKNEAEDLVLMLIPELCYLTGLRDEQRADRRLLRELASFTNVTPNQRLMALEKFHKNVNNNEKARSVLSGWGLTLESTVQEVQGRIMDEEEVQLARRAFKVGPQADFSKYVVNNELLNVVNLHNWLVVHWKGDKRVAESFWNNYENCSRALGVEVRKPTFVVLDVDRTDAYVNALRSRITAQTQMVVCICPTSRDDRYSAIKRICCSEIPTPSQVINARTLSNEGKNRSIVQKIALQINCKLGGSLWSIKIPFKHVMICGVDAYHDAGQSGKSVAGFVASLNSNYTKWYSKAIIQSKREEIVKGMCSALTASLYAYETENGQLPEKIIIFRDGVGDGQFQYCTGFEIPQLEEACRLAFEHNKIKITFIVVQKRINTRYFALSGDGASNPPPGSVVDAQITRSKMYDFFLVSQSTRQGTVSPTHYVVLRDDSGYKPDILQRLSYKLCFLYYNWPGTIRSPACCQYAHKMAALVGQSIGRVPSEELAKQLYYL